MFRIETYGIGGERLYFFLFDNVDGKAEISSCCMSVTISWDTFRHMVTWYTCHSHFLTFDWSILTISVSQLVDCDSSQTPSPKWWYTYLLCVQAYSQHCHKYHLLYTWIFLWLSNITSVVKSNITTCLGMRMPLETSNKNDNILLAQKNNARM